MSLKQNDELYQAIKEDLEQAFDRPITHEDIMEVYNAQGECDEQPNEYERAIFSRDAIYQ